MQAFSDSRICVCVCVFELWNTGRCVCVCVCEAGDQCVCVCVCVWPVFGEAVSAVTEINHSLTPLAVFSRRFIL